jgi:tRNA (guanine37-N1)-methyltransferase
MQVVPPMNQGMKTLAKNLFSIEQSIGALIVPVKSCKKAMELRSSGLLQIPRHPTIMQVSTKQEDSTKRLILLAPEIDYSSIETLPQKIKDFAKEVDAEMSSYLIKFDYDYWTTEQILKSILPLNLEVPSSFSTVGHIAHFNLRKDYDEYKHLIGQVVLSKSKTIKTVVNKTDQIDHTFRFFKMELLAGEDNMFTEMREANCIFKFDFSKVYWNSRLQGEHERLLKLFKPADIICDVFGGVGPFALPSAKNQKAFVFTNDLNPESYKYLKENILLNKVGDKVEGYNLDGREFIRNSLKLVNDKTVWTKFKFQQIAYSKLRRNSERKLGDQPLFPTEEFIVPNHYVMNLPAIAIEFLGTNLN